MARRGAREAGRANVPAHPFLLFPQEAGRATARLRELVNRTVEIAPSLDWTVAGQAGLTQRIERYLTYTHLDEGGVPLFTCHGWRRLFHMQAPVYRELVLEFFSTVEFDATSQDYEDRSVFRFRLGGEPRSCSIQELAWRTEIYTFSEAMSPSFVPFLNTLIVGNHEDYHEGDFWAHIAHGAYVPSNARENHIRSPIYRLLHRLLATSLTHHQSSEKVPSTDLFYLWCLVTEGVHLNLPVALAMFLARRAGGVRVSSPITGGHFVTKLAISYSILTPRVLQTLNGYDLRTIGARELETHRILQNGEIPDDDVVPLAQEGAPLPPPERRRRPRQQEQQQPGPEPEIDMRHLSRQLDSIQGQMTDMQGTISQMDRRLHRLEHGTYVQHQWTGEAMDGFFRYQGYQYDRPFPSPYQPYPDWYSYYQQPGDDEAGPSHQQQHFPPE